MFLCFPRFQIPLRALTPLRVTPLTHSHHRTKTPTYPNPVIRPNQPASTFFDDEGQAPCSHIRERSRKTYNLIGQSGPWTTLAVCPTRHPPLTTYEGRSLTLCWVENATIASSRKCLTTAGSEAPPVKLAGLAKERVRRNQKKTEKLESPVHRHINSLVVLQDCIIRLVRYDITD